MPLIEACAACAGVPRAFGLGPELELASYFELGVVAQWQLVQSRLAERVQECVDPLPVLRQLTEAPEPRFRFHVPGVISRVLAGQAALALQLLKPMASEEHDLASEAVQAFGVRPHAEAIGPDIVRPLLDWARDPSARVRRAAMEAVRPRGVWVKHLSWAVDMPAFLLPLVEALRGDDSEWVASAVGNALNDISRSSPELVLALVARWQEEGEAGPWQERIVRKGLRSLTKTGDPRALRLLGFEELDLAVEVRLRSGEPARPNSALVFELELENRDRTTKADLVYEIQTPGKNPERPRKQRYRAGVVEVPGFCNSQLLIRERIFDRKAAQLIDGLCRALFFLNGQEVAQIEFQLQRE